MDILISPKSYSKSPQVIDPDVFKTLRKLFTEIDWLCELEPSFLELWNLCINGHQQDLLIELIHRFSYITSRELKHCGEKIADHVTTEWRLDPSRTIMIAFAENDEPDGSQSLLQSIKNKFALNDGWSASNFVNKITAGANKLKSGDTAVLVDDFVGSGNTAGRRINWLLKILKKRGVTPCKIFMVALATMETAKSVLLQSIPIDDYFSCNWLRRGISEVYNGTELVVKTQLMRDLEEILDDTFRTYKLTTYNFGFKRSEALYNLEAYNIPNNVFPIFWWPVLKPGKKRNPMFRHFLG
jgi:hypothetical protein